MKMQLAVLIIVVLAGFSFIGVIIFNALPHESKRLVLLNTREMTGADTSAFEPSMGLAVVDAYLAGKKKDVEDAVPLADAFICVTPNKHDSTKTDTILLLDAQLQHTNKVSSEPAKYEAEVKPAKSLNKCRILIPVNELKKIKTYKYKYGKVVLVTDD